MKLLIQLLNATGEQILSTFAMVFIIYCLVTGVIALFTNPPSIAAILIIFGVGIMFGVLKHVALNCVEENNPKS
jgi:hypothetical protein